jgi:hypothetical protein
MKNCLNIAFDPSWSTGWLAFRAGVRADRRPLLLTASSPEIAGQEKPLHPLLSMNVARGTGRFAFCRRP